MNCGWCQNFYLIPCDYTHDSQPIEEDEILSFLTERKSFLDGVVITGGEPTIHRDLPVFCEKIKEMGFSVKLDTNGTNPDMLNMLIKNNLIDYIAMDIKTDFNQYGKLLREHIDIGEIIDSINLIMAFKKPYEFRTTCVSPFVNKRNICEIGTLIKGARQYFLQKCIGRKMLNGGAKYQVLTENDLMELEKAVAPLVVNCKIRNLQ